MSDTYTYIFNDPKTGIYDCRTVKTWNAVPINAWVIVNKDNTHSEGFIKVDKKFRKLKNAR